MVLPCNKNCKKNSAKQIGEIKNKFKNGFATSASYEIYLNKGISTFYLLFANLK